MHSQNEQASRLYQTAVPNNVCFFNQYYMADTMPILPWHAHDLYCFLVSKLISFTIDIIHFTEMWSLHALVRIVSNLILYSKTSCRPIWDLNPWPLDSLLPGSGPVKVQCSTDWANRASFQLCLWKLLIT